MCGELATRADYFNIQQPYCTDKKGDLRAVSAQETSSIACNVFRNIETALSKSINCSWSAVVKFDLMA